MINRQLLIGVVSVAALFVTGTASAASAAKIDREVTKTLELFAEEVKGAEEFLDKSAGYLVFPKVYKVGVGVGAESGEGALRVGGKTVGLYLLTTGIAISIALATGANPTMYALIVALSTSNSFLLPTHQVNALIIGPGGYRVADFVRAGGGMTVIFLVVMLTMVNLVF